MEEKNITDADIILSSQPIIVVTLLIVEIPAIACTLLILIYLFSHWRQLIIKAPHNHAILLLTIISFLFITLDLPFTISYHRLGYDIIRTLSFCRWWYWIDYTIICISLFLTATASIQRHILIFHSHWLRIQRRRWLLHFTPLILCILYPAFFYLGFMDIYPCETSYDEESLTCPSPCYSDDKVLYNIDWIVNTIFPVIVILLANVTLFIRVIHSMNHIRHTQRPMWKHQKKLSLQLFTFTSLYVIVWTPTTVISLLQSFFFPNLFEDLPALYYTYYMIYYICPLQVFIYIFTLPKLMKFLKTKTIGVIRRRRQVTPVISILPVHR